MMSDLEELRRRSKKKCESILDSQKMALASLNILQYHQIRMFDKDSSYHYVTLTDYICMDVENHIYKKLPNFLWDSKVCADFHFSPKPTVGNQRFEDPCMEIKLHELNGINLCDQHNENVLAFSGPQTSCVRC